MTELWTGYAIVLLIMFIGVMGNLIPGIPGTPLILAGAVGHQLYFVVPGWWWVAALAALGMVALGLDIFDNLDLDSLADTAAELNRWEFLLVASPLAVTGGTGSPVNALAIF